MFIRNERSIKEFMQFYPLVTGIILINMFVWLLIGLLSFSFSDTLYSVGVGHNLSVSLGDYWRLVTPVFMHVDITHLLFNCFAIILFAPALEQMLGKIKFILFYLVTGILGNVGTFVIDPYSMTPHLGASGSIYGLFGIYLFMIFFRKRLIDQSNAQIILVIFVIGLIMSFLQPNINIPAHIFGVLSGFMVAPIFLIGVERFSMTKNYMKRTRRETKRDEADISFDPDRWSKKSFRPKRKGQRMKFFWIVFILLVMIGFIAKYIPF